MAERRLLCVRHDLEMNFNKIAPFGKEDTAKELQDHAAKTQDTLVDAVENADMHRLCGTQRWSSSTTRLLNAMRRLFSAPPHHQVNTQSSDAPTRRQIILMVRLDLVGLVRPREEESTTGAPGQTRIRRARVAIT